MIATLVTAPDNARYIYNGGQFKWLPVESTLFYKIRVRIRQPF